MAVAAERVPERAEFVELIAVGVEAELGVIARGAGGDEELPVGGFEEQELAAELFDDALAEAAIAPLGRCADLAAGELGGVELAVGPGGFVVQPDLVVAFGAPGAFVQREEAAAREVVEVRRAGGEGDAGVVVVQDARDGLEPLDAFEPPMAEELGVERRAEDGRARSR